MVAHGKCGREGEQVMFANEGDRTNMTLINLETLENKSTNCSKHAADVVKGELKRSDQNPKALRKHTKQIQDGYGRQLRVVCCDVTCAGSIECDVFFCKRLVPQAF